MLEVPANQFCKNWLILSTNVDKRLPLSHIRIDLYTILRMWFADQYKDQLLIQEKMYENTITKKLYEKYGVNYTDLIPLASEDDNVWRKLDTNSNRLERRITDDGCEYYQHTDRRCFVLDYHFKDNEWREVAKERYMKLL